MLDLRGQQGAVLHHAGPFDFSVEHRKQPRGLEQKQEDHQAPAHAIPRMIAEMSIAQVRASDARSDAL